MKRNLQTVWAFAAVAVLATAAAASPSAPVRPSLTAPAVSPRDKRQSFFSPATSFPRQNAFRSSAPVSFAQQNTRTSFPSQNVFNTRVPTQFGAQTSRTAPSRGRSDGADVRSTIQGAIRNLASQGFTTNPNTYIVDEQSYYYSPSDYMYYYVLSDGSAVSQQGGLRADGVFFQQGFYSHVLDDNRRHTTSYTADDKGYVPEIKIEEPGNVATPGFQEAAIFG